MNLATGTRVHIVGVGGAGMSALAVFLQGWGCAVSGCDARDTPVLEELRERGIAVRTTHDASHVDQADMLLWSPAVGTGHVELLAGRARSLTMFSRPQVLGELSRMLRVVGITGTHGKTTATSMLVHVMAEAGRDDSRLVGAPVRGVGFSGHFGSGDLLSEVDESYGAFSEIDPFAMGLLNVEADHLDHYGTLEILEGAFADLLARTSGPVVVWMDDPGSARVAATLQREIIGVGEGDGVEWRLQKIEVSRRGARARLDGPVSLDLELAVPGRHNLINAAVAAVLALSLGVDARIVTEGLKHFRGAPRRFEHVATWRRVDVIDDYAHLPGEIVATVEAAKAAGYQKIMAVFQPHRVTRTLSVGSRFAPAFDDVDEVIVTDVYTAGEPNPEAVTGERVADAVRERGVTRARYAATLAQAASAIEQDAGDADLVLLLGAGDVTDVLNYLPHGRASLDGAERARDDFLGHGPLVAYDVALGPRTTYRVGGSAAAFLTMGNDADLEEMTERLSASHRPLWVVGNGSNLLVADGRHDIVAVHLEGEFKGLVLAEGDEAGVVRVTCGAALDLPVAARRLASEGVVGFEWAVGVPGTFGGAVAMNAGGHGSDMAASVVRVEVWTSRGRQWRAADAMSWGYRSSAVASGEIVTRVELALRRGDAQIARERVSQIVRWRREHQPGGANSGSVFANPEGDSAGRLIESAGLKGYRVGTAAVSEKHANFIIADADGTAADVWALIRLVRATVAESSGVALEVENRLLGFGESP